MSELIKKCEEQARKMHEGVTYGGNLSMMDQVSRTASLIDRYSNLEGEDREVAVAAAWLHKCFEAKRINGGKAMTQAEVQSLAGPKVAAVVMELTGEPEDKSKSKKDQWAEKASWAQKLSPAAREILLAEKVINFETTRSRMNRTYEEMLQGAAATKDDDPKSKPEWHKEYLETRLQMVEAIKDTNSRLACTANRAYYEAQTAVHNIVELRAHDMYRFMRQNQAQNG